jgi:hypothetical protein
MGNDELLNASLTDETVIIAKDLCIEKSQGNKMHKKHLEITKVSKMAHVESFIDEVESVPYNPFAYSEYRVQVLLPKDYDFELISDYFIL